MTTAPAVSSTQEFRRLAERVGRVKLAHLPTPLEELPRFSQALGGPRVLIKRDDCTGLAMGGNKTRHNEFLLAHALETGADTLVWGAGVQSNNCRQTVASCARLGLKCHLVLSRANHSDEVQGNLLLDHLLGATYEIVDVPVGPELDALILKAAQRLESQGRKVYHWNRFVVRSRAAISYALCMAEIMEQMAELGIEPAAVYVCSAGATGGGLALGKAALGLSFPVINVQPICWPWDEKEDMATIANEAARLLGLPLQVAPREIDATDAYVGPGYGVPTASGMEAIKLLARNEGILLDPVYTGKAMAALVDDVRRGRYRDDQAVVFIHTGGTPALFAYRDELLKMVSGESLE